MPESADFAVVAVAFPLLFAFLLPLLFYFFGNSRLFAYLQNVAFCSKI